MGKPTNEIIAARVVNRMDRLRPLPGWQRQEIKEAIIDELAAIDKEVKESESDDATSPEKPVN